MMEIPWIVTFCSGITGTIVMLAGIMILQTSKSFKMGVIASPLGMAWFLFDYIAFVYAALLYSKIKGTIGQYKLGFAVAIGKL
jgi:hypothetical protein